jgi:hypothetical protein
MDERQDDAHMSPRGGDVPRVALVNAASAVPGKPSVAIEQSGSMCCR